MRRAAIRYLLLCLPLLALAGSLACGDGGLDIDDTVEPAGRLAFSTERDGDREIYVLDFGTGDLVNLTNDPADDGSPSWHPDGDRIAFTSNRGESQFDIYVLDAGGVGEVERLTEDPAVEGVIRWSPDGDRMAFSSARDQSRGLLWVSAADGGEPSPVLEAITPSVPEQECAGGVPGAWLDGATILYRGSQGNISASQICSVQTDGSDLTVIRSDEGVGHFEPDLSPDGKRIVFVSNSAGDNDINVMAADGGDLTRLTRDPGNDSAPVWSPDGQWIAFASDRDGDLDIYIMRPDGSDLRQVTDAPGTDFSPAWAP